jgi:hypothetical protein
MTSEASSRSRGKQIEDVATELAGHVAAAIAATNPGSDPPEVHVTGSLSGQDASGELDAEAANTITGSVSIVISYNATKYGLSGTLPGSDDQDAYIFTLTMQRENEPEPTELAKFTYAASDNWSVSVTVPRWQVTSTFVIEEISATVTKLPAPPPGPAGESADALPA